MKETKNGYSLTRQWFEFSMENPDKIAPVHTALYLWVVELNNRLGWKEKFGLPTDYSMQSIGIRNRRTYFKALNELISWGFIEMVTKSTNQHTSNIIALTSACVKNTQASPKHCHKQVPSTARIDKQYKPLETIKTNTNLFSEKILLKFQDFIEEKKIVGEERINSLLNLLKSYSCKRDDYAGQIIDKAIAGGHSSFVALTKEEKHSLDQEFLRTDNRPFPDPVFPRPTKSGFIPPTEQEVIQYFSENGYNEKSARLAFNSWDVKQWVGPLEDWRNSMSKRYFKDENKQL